MKETSGAKVAPNQSVTNMDVEPSPTDHRTSRKHLRSSSDDYDYEWSSDESGRFDDADEPEMEDYKSPSAKSVKRRRSNDWPLPEEAADYGHDNRRNARSGNGGLGAGIAAQFKASPRASPRASASSLRGRHSAAASHSPRHLLGRRSRFVEANMSDSVSEKPPSIFMHENKRTAPQQHRSSGIFRFGKAIASAFNPFGGWSRSSPEHQNPQKPQHQTDALTQAELAYAELKKAGYKGTNKGSYMQSQNVDQVNADQTFQAIMEKMGYGGQIADSVQPPADQFDGAGTPSRSSSQASKRSSFQDLRKVGLPFGKSQETTAVVPSTHLERSSEESFDQNGLRKQKSRKELSRQAKLLKKVSNLEDKLDRARRELRQISGNEERTPAPTPELRSMSIDMDPNSYPRKFVPGALPTLPSERLLDQQATIPESVEPEIGDLTALPSVEGRASVPIDEQGPNRSPAAAKSPMRRSRDSRPSSMSKESFSRKRKSPVPEPVDRRPSSQSNPTNAEIDDHAIKTEHEKLTDSSLLSPPRQTKWQKFEAGDSPGAVERKQNIEHEPMGTTAQEDNSLTEKSPSVQPRRSPAGLNRSPNYKAMKSPNRIRTQPGRSNLRSVSPIASAISDSDPVTLDTWVSPSPPPSKSEAHQAFYLQPHLHLDPDRTPRSSPVKSSPKKRRRHEDIPPVPPLPEELLPNAAKVNKSPPKKKSPRKLSVTALSPQPSSVQNVQAAGLEDFLWPSDVF
ncbi:hypothetical protein PENSTE_c007G04787 [Penicillium steckii]|uniref:Nuclear RNA binding protein n=1 Tax=Penicillium steckii TaxID=303698 RepID=A0A1V6TF13_9EURO|nr:hypothetical protein PENSTE_c007G04787 [Penicillium steckii]